MGGRCIILNCIVGDRMRVSNVLVQRNKISLIHQNLLNDCYVLGTVFGHEHININKACSLISKTAVEILLGEFVVQLCLILL